MSLQALSFYLYSDTNAIPGLVLVIIASIVIAFIVLGKLMEVSGATQFLHRHRNVGDGPPGAAARPRWPSSPPRCSGRSAVRRSGNVMSTGIVGDHTAHEAHGLSRAPGRGHRIRGFDGRPDRAAGDGRTAFLMAEFLQISYGQVVLAALLPALLYYICLFMQVDAVAARDNLKGMKRPTCRSSDRSGGKAGSSSCRWQR